MDDKITYWASLTFGALALLLLVINVSLVNSNRHLQEEIVQRSALINKGMTFNQANQGLVQALAEISVRAKDTAARDLLAEQGITLKPVADAAKGDQKPDATAKDDKKKK